MPLKNFPTVGELQGYEYLRGVVSNIDHTTDTCDLSAGGEAYSDVPIFYHCKAAKAERGNGAITGGSWAFAPGDEVIVLRQRPGCPGDVGRVFVIGFTDGARRCAPVVIIFSTQSGEEAIAWDLINDVALDEFGSTYDDIAAALTAADVTEQDECVIDDTLWACDYLNNLLFKRDDCPATGQGLANNFVDEPFYQGSDVDRWVGTSISGPGFYDSGGECPFGWGYGVPYLFFTNPHPRTGQTVEPIPGPWVAYITGYLLETVWINNVSYTGKWDEEEWGECPYPEDQLYYTNPGNGWTYNRYDIPQTYLYFRSMFDYKFDAGTVPPAGPFTTVLTLPNLDLAATEMYNACRDGSLRTFQEIDNATWLEMNMSQYSYDAMEDVDNEFMNPDIYGPTGAVAMHPYFLMPYMIDKANGIATQDKTSVFFEFCGVYPDAYEFYEAGQVWNEERYAKWKKELRIYYRHPYPQKNMEAILFDAVNNIRTANSLKELAWNWNLFKSAGLMSDDMAERKTIDPEHVGSDGSTLEDRIEASYYGHFYEIEPATIGGSPVLPDRDRGGAENVYGAPVGLKWPLSNVVDNTTGGETISSHTVQGLTTTITGPGWMQSSGHAANILNEQVLETGLAAKKSANGSTYFTQAFGFLGDDVFWNGFSTFNPDNLLAYVNENFTFDKDPADTRRKPRIYLCTIPQT